MSFAGGLLSVVVASLFAFAARPNWVPVLISYAIGALLGAARNLFLDWSKHPDNPQKLNSFIKVEEALLKFHIQHGMTPLKPPPTMAMRVGLDSGMSNAKMTPKDRSVHNIFQYRNNHRQPPFYDLLGM